MSAVQINPVIPIKRPVETIYAVYDGGEGENCQRGRGGGRCPCPAFRVLPHYSASEKAGASEAREAPARVLAHRISTPPAAVFTMTAPKPCRRLPDPAADQKGWQRSVDCAKYRASANRVPAPGFRKRRPGRSRAVSGDVFTENPAGARIDLRAIRSQACGSAISGSVWRRPERQLTLGMTISASARARCSTAMLSSESRRESLR
ncbi:hypothetical protein BH20ACT10_BH20ACT10_17920 [soil metagenome]